MAPQTKEECAKFRGSCQVNQEKADNKIRMWFIGVIASIGISSIGILISGAYMNGEQTTDIEACEGRLDKSEKIDLIHSDAISDLKVTNGQMLTELKHINLKLDELSQRFQQRN